MSKKNKSSKKPRWKVPNVGAAMRAANQRGSYGESIAAKEIARQFGAMTRSLYAKPARKKPKLTKAERAARARVQTARRSYAASAARAARLPSKKPRTGKKVRSQTTRKPAAARRSSKKVPTVTAQQVVAKAAQTALKRWLCEGARRSGCGAGGSRVVTGKGSFVRLRPPRFMTAG